MILQAHAVPPDLPIAHINSRESPNRQVPNSLFHPPHHPTSWPSSTNQTTKGLPSHAHPTTMHEILTLQLGPTPNFLSTHYFNALESYFSFDPSAPAHPTNHDISFFAGLSPNGDETYLPRTLIYDLKRGFGSLRRVNALYEVEMSGGSLWCVELSGLVWDEADEGGIRKRLCWRRRRLRGRSMWRL